MLSWFGAGGPEDKDINGTQKTEKEDDFNIIYVDEGSYGEDEDDVYDKKEEF